MRQQEMKDSKHECTVRIGEMEYDGQCHLFEHEYGKATFWHAAIGIAGDPDQIVPASWSNVVVRLADDRAARAAIVMYANQFEDELSMITLSVVGLSQLASEADLKKRFPGYPGSV